MGTYGDIKSFLASQRCHEHHLAKLVDKFGIEARPAEGIKDVGDLIGELEERLQLEPEEGGALAKRENVVHFEAIREILDVRYDPLETLARTEAAKALKETEERKRREEQKAQDRQQRAERLNVSQNIVDLVFNKLQMPSDREFLIKCLGKHLPSQVTWEEVRLCESEKVNLNDQYPRKQKKHLEEALKIFVTKVARTSIANSFCLADYLATLIEDDNLFAPPNKRYKVAGI